MPVADCSDEDLMLRCARGDDEPFCELVRRHGAALLSFFTRSGVKSDAEDLAQKTFLKLHSARRRYAPTAKFTTFMFTVANRVLLDYLRATRRRNELHARAGAQVDAAVYPSRTRGESDDAAAALSSLSPPLRAAVVLVVMQGLAYGEAAEVLGVPTGTVKSRVHDALRRMRETLER